MEKWRKNNPVKEADSTYLSDADRIRINKQKINKLLKAVKPIINFVIYVAGSALAIFLLYLLYKLCLWIGKISFKVNHKDWVDLGIVFGGIAIFLLVIFLIYKLVVYLDKNNVHPGDTWLGKLFFWIGGFFYKTGKIIAYPFVYIFKKIRQACSFIHMMYKDNCPAIDWED